MTTRTPLPVDIIIPAWNEAAVIGRCLDLLKGSGLPAQWRLIVACNGCTDNTAQIAAEHGAQVLETEIASKPEAIRLAEQHCREVARIYLDADVDVTGAAIDAMAGALADGVLAVRPSIVYATDRSSALVRRYYRARSALPAVMGQLVGAGVYGLSPQGRARFGEYPDVVGEDNWVWAHFGPHEYQVLSAQACPPAVVHPPRTLPDLIRITTRARRGTRALVTTSQAQSTASSTVHDLGQYARTGLRPALDAAVYSGVTALARLQASSQARRDHNHWSRDDSSRAARP